MRREAQGQDDARLLSLGERESLFGSTTPTHTTAATTHTTQTQLPLQISYSPTTHSTTSTTAKKLPLSQQLQQHTQQLLQQPKQQSLTEHGSKQHPQ